jgi:hypothetical protein
MATMNHERQELKAAHRQLADQEKELSLCRKAWKDSLTLL